jgi:hypothetical protein
MLVYAHLGNHSLEQNKMEGLQTIICAIYFLVRVEALNLVI